MRVFLGLSDICGYYSQLELGLIANGAECVLINAFPDRGYARTTQPDRLGRLVESVARIRAAQPEGSPGRALWRAIQAMMQIAYCVLTIGWFDAYVFASGYSFCFGYDLLLLRILGKRILVVFHGTDARPPYMNAAVVDTTGQIDARQLATLTREKKQFITSIERRADVVINHTLTAHFHERPIVSWLSVGIPHQPVERNAPAQPAGSEDSERRRVVIVHAPTRPGPKGTDRIERAVDSLRNRGFDVELNKIAGRPNSEVLAAIAECDFVVDELFSDTTMASFATEAATFGKAAIVGTYGYDALRRYTSSEMLPPAFVCMPDGVEAAIEALVTDGARRRSAGDKARRFLAECWNRQAVGERYLRLIAGDIPSEWWFDPHDLTYFNGWGLTEERLREVLQSLISADGAGALCVADKPVLEAAMVAFASGSGVGGGPVSRHRANRR